jgi:hypothetical protein
VWWERKLGKWQAHLSLGGKTHHLGYYDEESDAARAYDNAARHLLGESAGYLNFDLSGNRLVGQSATEDPNRVQYRGGWVMRADM